MAIWVRSIQIFFSLFDHLWESFKFWFIKVFIWRMYGKDCEKIRQFRGIQIECLNRNYLRNPRNATGVMSQIFVLLLPVTSYQPKIMPDNQWMWLEGPFGIWWYASFWEFSRVKNWKLAILPTLRVASWWLRMDMNSVKVNCCKHDKKLGLSSCNSVKRVKVAHFWRLMFRANLRTSAPGVVL